MRFEDQTLCPHDDSGWDGSDEWICWDCGAYEDAWAPQSLEEGEEL